MADERVEPEQQAQAEGHDGERERVADREGRQVAHVVVADHHHVDDAHRHLADLHHGDRDGQAQLLADLLAPVGHGRRVASLSHQPSAIGGDRALLIGGGAGRATNMR